MSEWSYVIAAFALTWVTLAGYSIHLARRVRRAEARLRRAPGKLP